jgi:hypothetical protein
MRKVGAMLIVLVLLATSGSAATRVVARALQGGLYDAEQLAASSSGGTTNNAVPSSLVKASYWRGMLPVEDSKAGRPGGCPKTHDRNKNCKR